jgi:hypothetical protein
VSGDLESQDRDEFLTVLANFQWSLPLPKTPDLVAHAEFLYYACSGCVGVLHGWLTEALEEACHRRLLTITLGLLEETIDMTDALLMATAIRQGERDMDSKVSIKDLQDALRGGADGAKTTEADSPAGGKPRSKPGRRLPHRDEMGEDDVAV